MDSDDEVDAFAALLETDDGVRTLLRYIQAPDNEADDAGNALALFSDHAADDRIARLVHDAKLVDTLLCHASLGDVEDDLHLPIWRCLAAWAHGAAPLLVQQAFALRHASLSTTSLVSATLTSLVASMAQDLQPRADELFCGLVDADANGFCDLLKQYYVFGGNTGILDLVRRVLSTKAEAKALCSSGLLRLWGREWHQEHDAAFGAAWTALLSHLLHVLHPARPVLYAGSDRDSQWASAFLALALSPLKCVWMEMAPLVLDALTSIVAPALRAHPHCHGVARWLLSKHEAIPLAMARAELEAIAVDCERANHVALPTLEIGLTLTEALATATSLKATGNRWFRMGNHVAARQFYRLGLSTLKVAAATARQALTTPTTTAALPIGACIEVAWMDQSALPHPSDVDGPTRVEVIYDASGDDDVVALSRCRLCLSLSDQSALSVLQVALCMNLAKSLSHLRMVDEAIECLTFGLQLLPDHLPALYLRGLLHLQTMQLKHARDDFFRANKMAAERKDKPTQVQIHKAWKRLQVLTTQRKKADKKLIKEMMAYLDTLAIDGE
ncbi:hypothetical protein SPRG_07929 [Saprolegnia parasitica CBS 223.65]|uniref:Uncharacterized protein n=1 Tax=Saprolegnia parasitica (strain CBS 223.65) TaxID=695850 RepID=A0A067CI81_SAPPC|nr:hypothetical protein SPRG_07929 [Saprolegnia parasitica CBS 223.65]KDO26527.1 hypothetical protein SPRG_07929 [Saprolegnia parasitica CBS 223.65]|eukprot:XP_012202670.1 hypothetical protein SPRG_07929 [Saprolegnia parasitica CBS 223.65]